MIKESHILPQFFRVGNINYFKLIDYNFHLHITKADFKSNLYPDIKINSNRSVDWVGDFEWEEIDRNEFYSAYDETLFLIQKIGQIL